MISQVRKKRASEIFGVVDPNLKVIDGRNWHHSRGERARKLVKPEKSLLGYSKPKPVKEDELWEKSAGVICPKCKNEVFQIIYGMCRQCWRRKNIEDAKAMEYNAMALTYRAYPKRISVSSGRLSLR